MEIPGVRVEVEGARCPACGAQVRMASFAEDGRVQCPICGKALNLPLAKDGPRTDATAESSRLSALEARLASVERALAATHPDPPPERPKFHWVTDKSAGDFCPAQAEVLRHNLSIITPHPVVIQSPVGDAEAFERAEWFKEVFERAHWPVQGPENAPPGELTGSVVLATQLPVPPEAAMTYLAIRAAGFDLDTIFDPDSPVARERLIVS